MQCVSQVNWVVHRHITTSCGSAASQQQRHQQHCRPAKASSSRGTSSTAGRQLASWQLGQPGQHAQPGDGCSGLGWRGGQHSRAHAADPPVPGCFRPSGSHVAGHAPPLLQLTRLQRLRHLSIVHKGTDNPDEQEDNAEFGEDGLLVLPAFADFPALESFGFSFRADLWYEWEFLVSVCWLPGWQPPPARAWQTAAVLTAALLGPTPHCRLFLPPSGGQRSHRVLQICQRLSRRGQAGDWRHPGDGVAAAAAAVRAGASRQAAHPVGPGWHGPLCAV